MQSEKLLRKIRAIITTSPADEPEWHSDRVWQKVQQRQKRKQLQFFAWKSAAAVIVIGLVGLLFSTKSSRLFHVDTNISTQKDTKKPPFVAVSKATDLVKKAVPTAAVKQNNAVAFVKILTKINATKSQPNRTSQHIDNDPTIAYELNSATVDNSINVNNLAKEDLPEMRFSIAHLKSEELSPLLDMYRQAQQERENRKMNITLADIHRPIPLWFHANVAFVGRDLNLNNDPFPTFRH